MIKHKKFKREDLIKYLPNGIVAEVGVALGNFSESILALNNPSKLILIDAWQNFDLGYRDGNMVKDNEQQERYESVINKFKSNKNITIIRKKSLDAISDLQDELLDWVYIDADHSYQGCLADLRSYDKKVKENGYICGHDWLSKSQIRKGFGVNQAVIDFVSEREYVLTLITKEKKYMSYVISKNKTSSENLLKRINDEK